MICQNLEFHFTMNEISETDNTVRFIMNNTTIWYRRRFLHFKYIESMHISRICYILKNNKCKSFNSAGCAQLKVVMDIKIAVSNLVQENIELLNTSLSALLESKFYLAQISISNSKSKLGLYCQIYNYQRKENRGVASTYIVLLALCSTNSTDRHTYIFTIQVRDKISTSRVLQ